MSDHGPGPIGWPVMFVIAVAFTLGGLALHLYFKPVHCDPPYLSGRVYCDSKVIGDQLQ